MRPDHRLREGGAEAALRRALRQYAEEHAARDLCLYVAHRDPEITWNELQSRAGLPPAELSARLRRVEEYLRDAVEDHLS